MLEVRQQPQHDAMHLASQASWTTQICVTHGLAVIGLIMDFLSHLNTIFRYHSLYCDRTIFPATYIFKLRYCYTSHLRSLFQSLRRFSAYTLLEPLGEWMFSQCYACLPFIVLQGSLEEDL